MAMFWENKPEDGIFYNHFGKKPGIFAKK